MLNTVALLKVMPSRFKKGSHSLPSLLGAEFDWNKDMTSRGQDGIYKTAILCFRMLTLPQTSYMSSDGIG